MTDSPKGGHTPGPWVTIGGNCDPCRNKGGNDMNAPALRSKNVLYRILNGRATNNEARQIALYPEMAAILRDALPLLQDHAGTDDECPEWGLVERIERVLEAIEGRD